MGVQLSDSTAIIILGTIAGLYFTLTAACSMVICRIWCKRQKCTSKEPLKFPASTSNDYELAQLKEVKAIKDRSSFVSGDRAKKWRQYISNQPLRSNGTSYQQNGTQGSHYSSEQPKLPAIEEVGEGVSVWSGEGESSVGVWRKDEVQEMGSGNIEENSITENRMRSQWMAKRKVRGRTSSTKFLLEETDGSSNWTLTSVNDANGSVLDGMTSSLSLTASLPGPVLAQVGRSNTDNTPIPRPIPRNTQLPRSMSPVCATKDDTNTGTASGQQSASSHIARSESERTSSSPENGKKPQSRRRKQLSVSTHSLPRHLSNSTQPHPLQKQLSLTGGSGTLPPAETTAGSRPKLRRYASTAPYSSTPSLEPVVLVRPRSRLKKQNSYQSNTLGRSSFPERSSVTSIEMERNFYTLQTRRGDLGGEGRGSKETSAELRESVLAEKRATESEIAIQDNTAQKHIVGMDKHSLAPVIDLGHDAQDSSEV